MSKARRINRESTRAKIVLKTLIDSFFKKSVGKDDAEVLKKYKAHEGMWREYVRRTNESSSKEAFLMVDLFEACIAKAHQGILLSDNSAKTKLNLLRVLHPVQGRNKLVYFFREVRLWIRYAAVEYRRDKKRIDAETIGLGEQEFDEGSEQALAQVVEHLKSIQQKESESKPNE